METRRTTVVLAEDLYRQAKRIALEEDKSLKEIIEEAVRTFLGRGYRGRRRTAGARFGVYPGKAVADVRRETLYKSLRK